MPRPILLFTLLVVLAAGAASANPILVPLVAEVDFEPAGEVSLTMIPDGSGTPFAAAWSVDGSPVDATLRIHLVDDGGYPMIGVPVEDVWLLFDVPPGTAAGCDEPPYYEGARFCPDAESDSAGMMEWTLPVRGGGWAPGPAVLYIVGMPAMTTSYDELPAFPIRINSPDIDGDLDVDLTDITFFAQDLGGPYHYRSDLHWDGVLDLSDIVVFVQGIGATCP